MLAKAQNFQHFSILMLEFQRITAQQTQGHLSSIWSDAHGSYCSNYWTDWPDLSFLWAFSLSLFDPTWGSSISSLQYSGFIHRMCNWEFVFNFVLSDKNYYTLALWEWGREWGEVHLPPDYHTHPPTHYNTQTPSWLVFKMCKCMTTSPYIILCDFLYDANLFGTSC